MIILDTAAGTYTEDATEGLISEGLKGFLFPLTYDVTAIPSHAGALIGAAIYALIGVAVGSKWTRNRISAVDAAAVQAVDPFLYFFG